VGAWLVPWTPYGCCEGVAGPLVPVLPLWNCGRYRGSLKTAVEALPVPWIRMVAVEAWPVSWTPYNWCGGVAKLLGTV